MRRQLALMVRSLNYYRGGPTSKLLLLTIAAMPSAATSEGQALSMSQLADMTGMCKPTVLKAVRALEDDGWLVVHRGKGRGNMNRYAVGPKLNGKKQEVRA